MDKMVKLADFYDRLTYELQHWKYLKWAVLSSIILGSILWICIIPVTNQFERETRNYYQSFGVDYQPFQVKTASDVTIHGIALIPINASEVTNGTIPAILQINGANNRKERNHDVSINFALQGFAIFIIEQRGHGESSGRASFYGEEPGDVKKVIDYMLVQYPFINQTHIGALGFSLGAGCLLIAQALDSRIYACSLFHPPTDIGAIFQQVDITHIAGTFFFQRPSYAPSDVDAMVARTAFYWCNSSNTNNILLIQGDADTKVPATVTELFWKTIDGANRPDLQLKIRPGLGHEPNEANATSRKMAIAWLVHYFINFSMPISPLEDGLAQINLVEFNPPDRSALANLAWAGIIFIEIGMLLSLVKIKSDDFPRIVQKLIPKKIYHQFPNSQRGPLSEDLNHNQNQKIVPNSLQQIATDITATGDPQLLFLRQMVVLSILILPIAFILGLINGFTVPNLLIGLFFELPLISGGLFYLLKSYYGNQKHNRSFPIRVLNPFPFNAPTQNGYEIILTVLITLILLAPPLIGISIYDWSARQLLLWPVQPWKSGFWFYFFIVGMLFYTSHTFVEEFLEKKSYIGMIGLTMIWILGASVYNLFNPVDATFGRITLSFLIVFGFGILVSGIGIFQRRLKKVFGKFLVAELIIAEIVALFLVNKYMDMF